MKPHLTTSARPATRSRAPAASPGSRDRRRPPTAGGTRPRGSCPRADRRRSCRRRTRRPSRAASSARARTRRRAGRWPRRSRRGRWRRRRPRPRRPRADRSPPSASHSLVLLDLRHRLAGLAGRQVAARHAAARARAAPPTSGSTRGERFADLAVDQHGDAGGRRPERVGDQRPAAAAARWRRCARRSGARRARRRRSSQASRSRPRSRRRRPVHPARARRARRPGAARPTVSTRECARA